MKETKLNYFYFFWGKENRSLYRELRYVEVRYIEVSLYELGRNEFECLLINHLPSSKPETKKMMVPELG